MTREDFLEELNSYPSEFIIHHQNIYLEEDYYMICLASYGDYDNSCEIERANKRWLDEHYGEIVSTVYGHYHAELCVIHADIIDSLEWSSDHVQKKASELIEALNGLTDYSCFDDMLASQVALELQNETWENCYKRDVVRIFDKRFPELDIFDFDLDESAFRETFEEKAGKLNLNWEIQSGGNAYIEIDRIAYDFSEQEVKSLIKTV